MWRYKRLNTSVNALFVFTYPKNVGFIIHSEIGLTLNLVNDWVRVMRVIEKSGADNYKVEVNDFAERIYFLRGQED